MPAAKTPPFALKMLWGLFRRVVKSRGWLDEEAKDYRTDITSMACGCYTTDVPSWSALKPGQIDALKEALNTLLDHLPLEATPAGAESPADAAHRRRLVWGIEHDFTAAYGSQLDGETAIASTLSDIYGVTSPFACGHWRSLPLADLDKLRTTAARCLRGQISKTDRKSPVEASGNPF